MPVASRQAQPDALPPGMLRQIVTYLEMAAPPPVGNEEAVDARLQPPAHLAPDAYRALYRAVGERWLWWERLALSDPDLAAILDDLLVEVRLLRCGGITAGYSEIDRRAGDGTVEIAFLGLVPEFTGRGLGRALLAATLRAAWHDGAQRQAVRKVWLHTCNCDHPAALGLYLSAGFRIVRRKAVLIDDPRLRGLLPATAGPHLPLAGLA